MNTPSSPRQKFIAYLVLRQLAPRTVQSYTDWIIQLSRFRNRPPADLGNPDISSWLLHLIEQRKLSASSINLAINALRSFYGGHLGREIEPLLAGIKRPTRHTQPPRVFSPDEVERLLTVGTNGDPLARAFLMTVYGCGLRLSEATHVCIPDIDSKRFQLRVSNPKGGRERLVPLSDNLLRELRAWYRVHRPTHWLFSQGPDQDPISKGTAQNIYYRARRRAQLPAKCGIHGLRHSFATHLIENGVEITLVQKFLGHAYLSTTALYLHVRQERMGQVKSPLGLIRTDLQPRR
jgi:site-specific recombinase XerD